MLDWLLVFVVVYLALIFPRAAAAVALVVLYLAVLAVGAAALGLAVWLRGG